MKQFILKKRPQVIVVAAECRETMAVVDDMKMCIAELEQENQIPSIPVEALDGEVARVFMGSPRSEVCHPIQHTQRGRQKCCSNMLIG